MWPRDAYVGQEVVAVHMDNVSNPWHKRQPLILGRVYRVLNLHTGLHTNELHFVIDDGTPRYWIYNHFKPVQKKQTDISIFTALLNPAKESLDA